VALVEEKSARPAAFGELLRRWRESAGLSQRDLAQRARLSTKAVGALERGERRRPHPHTVRALAEALGLSPEDRAALHRSVPSQRREVVVELLPGPAPAATTAEQAAAWGLYVELMTRTATAALAEDEGVLREALDSLHSLFGTVRTILREHGPGLGRLDHGAYPVASLAMGILSEVLRPVLSAWHPRLLDHENRRPAGVSPIEHERAWDRNAELRHALAETQAGLEEYAKLLAAAAGVPHTLGADGWRRVVLRT
jgi:transcriptional regulator with XRE-family HTH domain